jgi:hypothetical protein
MSCAARLRSLTVALCPPGSSLAALSGNVIASAVLTTVARLTRRAVADERPAQRLHPLARLVRLAQRASALLDAQGILHARTAAQAALLARLARLGQQRDALLLMRTLTNEAQRAVVCSALLVSLPPATDWSNLQIGDPVVTVFAPRYDGPSVPPHGTPERSGRRGRFCLSRPRIRFRRHTRWRCGISPTRCAPPHRQRGERPSTSH